MVVNFKLRDDSLHNEQLCHYINGRSLRGPFPVNLETAMFGMGCFWGVEKIFWPLAGIWVTAVGYSGGTTSNPTYEKVCSGTTNHNEVVLLKYDPNIISYPELLKNFWEGHDPTQGNRQGNDIGTQYRSGIYTFSQEQKAEAIKSKQKYNSKLRKSSFGEITTEIVEADDFFYAEDYHQQYLAKNPRGYCGIGGTGVIF